MNRGSFRARKEEKKGWRTRHGKIAKGIEKKKQTDRVGDMKEGRGEKGEESYKERKEEKIKGWRTRHGERS